MTTVHAALPNEVQSKSGTRSPIVRLDLLRKGKKRLMHLEGSLSEILRAVRDHGGVGIFDLEIEGKGEISVMVQSVEKKEQQIVALSLREVMPDDFLKIEVELAATNLPDLVLQRQAQAVRLKKHIKVRAQVKDIPRRIVVDLSEMSPKDTFVAGDVSLPKGVELVTPKDAALFTVRTAERV